jgi:hypothetical protein
MVTGPEVRNGQSGAVVDEVWLVILESPVMDALRDRQQLLRGTRLGHSV